MSFPLPPSPSGWDNCLLCHYCFLPGVTMCAVFGYPSPVSSHSKLSIRSSENTQPVYSDGRCALAEVEGEPVLVV